MILITPLPGITTLKPGSATKPFTCVDAGVFNERGEEVGMLETILEIPDNHVFVVRKGTEEVLIPAAKSFVTSVDLARRRMLVRGIDDLVEARHAV